MMSEFRMKAMKKAVLSLSLPLLLALSPSAASAARILWVSVEPGAMVVDEGVEVDPVSQFAASGKVINAARVSVDDGSSSGPTYLLFAYDDDTTGSSVVDDPASDTMPLIDDSGAEPVFAGMSLAPVYLSDILDGIDDSTVTVTLELGYVDWDDYDAKYEQYENDPTGLTISIDFTRLVYASSPLSVLADPNGEDGNHVSTVASLDPAGHTPWSPKVFTPVPEPATCWTALLGAFLLSKRRKSRTAAA